MLDGAEHAGQLVHQRVLGKESDGPRVVDFGQDESERGRLDRRGHDPVAVGHDREVGRPAVGLGRLGEARSHAEHQVVLGLPFDQERPGDIEEVAHRVESSQLHGRQHSEPLMADH